jgi:magnesium chelatase family protein
MDRIDIQIELPRLEHDELINHRQKRGESSKQVRKRVIKARARQLDRQHCLNANMANLQIEQYCKLDQAGERLLLASIDKLKLTARSYHKILRLARTIADMAEDLDLRDTHLAEAIAYRQADRRWNGH